MSWWVIIGLVLFAALVWLAWEVATAPLDWEGDDLGMSDLSNDWEERP